MNLVERIKDLPVGTKVTLSIESMLGQIVQLKATITGRVEQHGFLSTTSGAWSLYGGQGWEPCYMIPVRPYGKKRDRFLHIGLDIHDMKIGWEKEE